MVFDEQGQQMPDFQGLYADVREKILAAAGEGTEFQWGDWVKGIRTNMDRRYW